MNRIRYKKGDILEYRLNQTNQIKIGRVIEATYADDSVPNLGDFYIISDGEINNVGSTNCYVVSQGDIINEKIVV